ncbi:carbohydrate ABC transporter permease [Xylanibacillus composti]|uniref:Sugar ABC transporter permease n=1 Tax=Xylanibacillus composti TaxID=1572762 RepID=A0A8J4M4T9_9BACL|nr:carbohydrate ABC transporter permease [Xylanibacillus composti]MDT9725710.1 carbohydrate ABC transporter permease [Xylanibacillus composti]GIQ71151.1 sugar ABC transporter permease [Xylanibacillus composti]
MRTTGLAERLIQLFFLLLSIAMVLPFILVVCISITEEQSLLQNGYRFIPESLSLDAYRYVFESPVVLMRAYGVTITVTLVGTAIGLLMTAMTAYVISRRDFRYNRSATFYIFFTMLFSGGIVSFYILMTQFLQLRDTLWALILPGLLTPWNVMVMKGFLSKIPLEIVESAKMDGAREVRIFFTMILPLATPALATIGLLISFTYWNEWFNSMLFIDSDNKVPLQLMLVRIMNTIEFLSANAEFTASLDINQSEFPSLSMRMAMAVLAAGPMLCIFPFFQRYFVRGLTIGSLKG